MRKLLVLMTALAALPVLAHAQSNPGFANGQVPSASQWNSYFANKIDTNNGQVNNLNNTGTYQINGLMGLSFSTAGNEQTYLSGPYAGASLPAGSQFIYANGAYAFESMNEAICECVAVGPGAGIAVTTGGGFFAGISTGASTTTQGGSTAINTDAMRDYVDNNSAVAIGVGVLGDGIGTNNIGVGNYALKGAAATISFTGTPTAGDVIKITVGTTNACSSTPYQNCTTGTPYVASYTVQAGDTTSNEATGITSALNASGGSGVNYYLGDGVLENSHNAFNMHAVVASGNSNVVWMHVPYNWLLTYTFSCTGSGCGSESATIGTGMNGAQNNVVVATNGLDGPMITNPQNNVIIGANDASGNNVTNPSNNVFLGEGIAQSGLTNGSWNSCIITLACANLTNGGGNVVDGFNAGSKLTSGSNNWIQGNGVASTTLQTGSNNVLGGYSSAVDTPASNTSKYMNLWGAHIENLTAPTIASGFGTSPSVPAGGTTEVFTVNVGTGGSATSGVVTMGGNAAPTGWACPVRDITNPASADTVQTAYSTTTITLSNYSRTSGASTAWAASDVLLVGPCDAF